MQAQVHPARKGQKQEAHLRFSGHKCPALNHCSEHSSLSKACLPSVLSFLIPSLPFFSPAPGACLPSPLSTYVPSRQRAAHSPPTVCTTPLGSPGTTLRPLISRTRLAPGSVDSAAVALDWRTHPSPTPFSAHVSNNSETEKQLQPDRKQINSLD